jgi:AbrB family looped-hinge helix DNA binding protein
MNTIKVGRRGQITLPMLVRRKYGLQEGDRIALIEQGDQMILRPITQTLLNLRGSVKVSESQDFPAIRERVIRDHAAKVARDGE